MKKVLYVTNLPAPYRVAFLERLARRVELTVIYERSRASDRNPGWKSAPVQRPYRELYLKGLSVFRENRISPGIVRHLRHNSYDAILLSNYNSPAVMYAIRWLRRKGIPFGLSCDGMLPKTEQGSGWRERLKGRLIASASFWLSTGETTTRELCRYGADPDRVYQLPFSSVSEAELDREDPDPAAARRRLGLPEEQLLLYVGRFIPVKGLPVLLEAYRSLRTELGEKAPGLLLVGGTEEQLAALCGAGLHPGVRCVEFQPPDRIADYYRAAELLVFPTLGDSWGLVVNEAMAHGLPVITTERCGAGLEMVRPGENGYLVPAGSPEALTQAIKRGLALSGAAEAARRTAARYTLEAMASQAAAAIERETGSAAD